MPSYLEREQGIERVQPQIDNIQALMNLYQTKVNLYGIGAGQLKSEFNNLMNMDLTLDSSRAKLHDKLQTADKSLRGYTKLDFGVFDNVKAASGVFDPITKDQDLLLDNALTTRIKGQLSVAESQRLSNSGKDYDPSSVAILNSQLALFKKVGKPQFAATILGMNPTYTPYYDKTSEVKKLQEMFKTDKTSTMDAQGGYLITKDNQSWEKSRWQKFLMDNASPQLKAQLDKDSQAQYLQQLVYTDPKELQARYSNSFNYFHNNELMSEKDKLNEYSLKLSSLNPKTANYTKLKAEYEKAIGMQNSKIMSLNDPSNPDNIFPDITDPEKLGSNIQYASALSRHEYFDKLGTDFAHTDVTYKLGMDGAYWANKRLQKDYAQMIQDAKEHKDEMDFDYTKLAQDRSIENAKLEVDMWKAGLKYSKDGKLQKVEDGNIHQTNQTLPSGSTDPSEVGKMEYDSREKAYMQSAVTIADNLMTKYFDASGLVLAMNDPSYVFKKDADGKPTNAEKTFAEFSTMSGGGQLAKDKILNTLVDAYYGSELFNRLGATESNPADAKAHAKRMLMNEKVSKIKELTAMMFENPRMLDIIKTSIMDKDKGLKMLGDLEILKQSTEVAGTNFDSKYASDIMPTLKKYNYPEFVDPVADKWLFDKGVRGYMQNGSPRVPTESELKYFINSKPAKDITQRDFDEHWLKSQGTDFVNTMNPFNTAGDRDNSNVQAARDRMFNDMRNGIYTSIGAKAKATANLDEITTPVNEKNRSEVINKLVAYTGTVSAQGDEKAKDRSALVSFIQKYPNAVGVLNEQGSINGGTSTFTVSFDDSKLSKEAKAELAELGDYQSIKIKTDSELFPQILKKGNPGYLALMQHPDWYKVKYQGQPDLSGSFYIENSGGFGGYNNSVEPNFKTQFSFYYPVLHGNEIKNELITQDNIGEKILDRKNLGDWQQRLQSNPAEISEYIKKIMNQGKYMIEYLSKNNITSWMTTDGKNTVPDDVRKNFITVTED